MEANNIITHIKEKNSTTKTFQTFNAKLFLDIFYTLYREGETLSFTPSETTMLLLCNVQQLLLLEDITKPRINSFGKVKADVDKLLRAQSRYCMLLYKLSVKDCLNQKEKAFDSINYGKSKYEQDQGFEIWQDKDNELKALNKAYDSSLKTEVMLTKQERKEIVKNHKPNLLEKKF